MKIKEHDCVVLTKNLPEENLEAGDVGTVVHIHKDGAAYEVEFVTLAGRTVRWQPLRRPICVPSASGTSAMCGNCRRPD